MRLYVIVNDTAYTDAVDANTISISKDISDRASTAEITFFQKGGPSLARYDTATYDNAVYGVDVRELYEIRVEDDQAIRHFAGRIVRIEYERKNDKLTFLKVACTDYTSILDAVTVPDATFSGQTDRAILQSLINTYAPELTALTDNIDQLETLGLFEVKAETLRSAIDRICDLTGAEWRVDYDANFRYFTPQAYPAPFGLTSQPNTPGALNPVLTWNSITQKWEDATFAWDANSAASAMTWDAATGTWDSSGGATWDSGLDFLPTYGIDAFTGYTRDAVRIINSCRVIGGFLPGGAEIDIIYEDPVSILEYGRRAHTIVDREISLAVDASLRAKAVVEQHAYPEESFRLSTNHDGLDVGQSLPIYHPDYQINGAYIIRSIRLSQQSKTITNYELELGVKPPDELRLLRQLEARTRQSTQASQAIPVDGSVTTGSISGLGLSTGVLVGTIDVSGDVGINANAIFGTITGNDVTVDAAVVAGTISGDQVTVDAGTIQGVITGDDVLVDVTTFQGVIVSSQVADSLINRLAMFADGLRPIPSAAAEPSLPDTNYPLNSFYYNTTESKFYRNDAGNWTQVTESEAVTGKLEYYHIGTIRAGAIIGLIAAGQIDTITAGQISGQIQAAQIAAVNASAITGTITASQIATVNASSIQGSISASQIASVNASSITGTISSTQIGSINAATITIGLIGNSQISTVSASKLTAGTIDASVITVINLNATNITSGNMSVDRLTAGSFSVATSSQVGINISFSTTHDTDIGPFGLTTVSGSKSAFLNCTDGAVGISGVAGSFSVNAAIGISFTSASAGAASALPATPAGYLMAQINGTNRKIPYYA